MSLIKHNTSLKKDVLYTLQYIKENVTVIYFKIVLFLFSFFFNMLFISRKVEALLKRKRLTLTRDI